MIITIINQKGGVGKTTTAQALGAGLHERGYKLLYMDLDPQGNLTDALGKEPNQEGVYQLLMTGGGIISPGEYGDVMVASPLLAKDITLPPDTLQRAIAGLIDEYDHILIDTPPALGTLSINALGASQGLIIPAQADRYSLQGIGQLYQTIQAVKSTINPDVVILGIVLTRHNPRTILGADVADMMRDTAHALGTRLFKSTIREAVAIREAQYLQRNPLEYAKGANVTYDYIDLAGELLEEVRKHEKGI